MRSAQVFYIYIAYGNMISKNTTINIMLFLGSGNISRVHSHITRRTWTHQKFVHRHTPCASFPPAPPATVNSRSCVLLSLFLWGCVVGSSSIYISYISKENIEGYDTYTVSPVTDIIEPNNHESSLSPYKGNTHPPRTTTISCYLYISIVVYPRKKKKVTSVVRWWIVLSRLVFSVQAHPRGI